MTGLLSVSLRALVAAVFNPFFAGELVMVYGSYRRENSRREAGLLTLRSAAEGILVGAGMLLITAGSGILIKPDPALLFIGPVSWLLSLADRRFFCFSYGAVAVITLWQMLRRPIDAAGILTVVGLLHLGEGILVGGSGQRGRVLRFTAEGGTVKARLWLMRLWPIPLGLLVTASGGSTGLTMPSWWPLLGPTAGLYRLLPVAAGVGYEEPIREEKKEKQQTRRRGRRIAGYGLLLAIAGLGSSRWPLLREPALLWMLIGHELLGK